MKYELSDITRLLFQIFRLSNKCTEAELKSAFRARAKELHPDIDPFAGDKFVEMKEAYDFITANANFLSGNSIPQTENGVLLSSLGLGLGPLKNGKDCGICQHKGYVEHQVDFLTCGVCHGAGFSYDKACSRCKGSGQYTNKKGDAIFACFKCKGTGAERVNRLSTCYKCKGSGHGSRGNHMEYEICYQCKGTGEIEIFNPVLPKGLLVTR